jgi:hypothetical protein
MLTPDIQNQLLTLLSKASDLSIVSADQGPDGVCGLIPGQRVTAEVLATLPDNRALVQVGTGRFSMEMPVEVRPGHILEMTFVSATPRMTFALARQGDASQVNLSDTTRWLSGLREATGRGLPAVATADARPPLLDGQPLDPARTGGMLQQGLRHSGLFYESHLAQWFGGEYPLEQLLREPQGQLSSVGRQSAAAQLHDGIADQRTLPVVQEQLSALQSGHVVFQGDLFPGQKLEWKVAERDAQENRRDGQERSWDTALAINLPKLGSIRARLILEGNRVSIDICTDGAESAGFLNKERPGLVEQLEAAGLMPGEIGVRHGAP